MNFIFRVLGVILLMLDIVLTPIFWLRRTFGRRRHIPHIDNDILLLSACELAHKIRRRSLTSLYVIASYIDRIQKVNPILNAVTDERFDLALAEAKAVDEFLTHCQLSEAQLAECKPFLGVPITIKESCGVGDLSQSVGSIARRGIKCTADCPSVQRLKSAGFIPLAVSNVPELCVGIETFNLLNGRTNNPYNTHYTVGGSSGGEAALLSAAASVVGIGSDYAGSIRIPCMFTGLFGHKTTPRIIDRSQHFPNTNDKHSYDYFAIGPMVRYAIDLKPVLRILCGDCLQLDETVISSSINVFYTTDYYELFGVEPVSKRIRHGLQIAQSFLQQECKMNVRKTEFREMRNCAEISAALIVQNNGDVELLTDPNDHTKRLNLYKELLKSIFGLSPISIQLLATDFIMRRNAFLPRSHLPLYKHKMDALKKDICDTLGENGVLLFPTFPSSAFQHFQVLTKAYGVFYSMIFNVIGCPVTQVPIGLDDKGLPIGIQVIASPRQDRLCLAVAESLEKCFGGWKPPTQQIESTPIL